METTHNKCCYVMQKGPSAGNPCGAPATKGPLCFRHKFRNIEQIIDINKADAALAIGRTYRYVQNDAKRALKAIDLLLTEYKNTEELTETEQQTIKDLNKAKIKLMTLLK